MMTQSDTVTTRRYNGKMMRQIGFILCCVFLIFAIGTILPYLPANFPNIDLGNGSYNLLTTKNTTINNASIEQGMALMEPPSVVPRVAPTAVPSVVPTVTPSYEEKDFQNIDQLFDAKRKSIQLRSGNETDVDCFCPNGRKNWIHYTGCSGAAGIKDRQNIIRSLMWFADELCANISFQCTPKEFLLRKDHGCYAPESATWNDYFTPVRTNRNVGASSTRDIVVLYKVDLLYYEQVNVNTFQGLEKIEGRPSRESYELGRKLHSEGVPFVWNFYKHFFHSPDFNIPAWPNQNLNHRNYTDSCGMLDLDASQELLDIGQFILQELNITSSHEFITLHLRRGDFMNCDTGPAAVMRYLDCSIDKDDVKQVLVLTNGEKWYRRILKERFSESFPEKKIIILDEFIETEIFIEKLKRSNILSSHSGNSFLRDNCFSFSAERVLVSMSRYHLDRGRHHCTDCDRGGSNDYGAHIIR